MRNFLKLAFKIEKWLFEVECIGRNINKVKIKVNF